MQYWGESVSLLTGCKKDGRKSRIDLTKNGPPFTTRPFLPAPMSDAVFGSLRFEGKAKSVHNMNAAVADEARRRGHH
jgi:hypothetical protein